MNRGKDVSVPLPLPPTPEALDTDSANSRFPPGHLLPSPGSSNRFPLGHPMNPYPAQENSPRSSGCFSSISFWVSKLHFDLPSTISGNGGGGVVAGTIFGPKQVRDNFHHYRNEDEFRRVVAKIETIYRDVNLDSESLENGYCCCLGLLNPKSNILVNSSISNFSRRNASPSPSSSSSPADMAERSLHGLTTFLTCLFPYLPVAEALAYLDAADADALAAAALIVARRGGRNYCWNHSSTSPAIAAATMAMALKCGAVAARHPDPSLLVKGWTSLSHCLRHIAGGPLNFNSAGFVHRNLQKESPNLEFQAAWELADDRLREKLFSDNNGGLILPKGLRLPPVRAAMKRVLLAKIHGFYPKALCSIPMDELTEKYHRALVMGGYCYGPLTPAANIIVNMIWHEQTFPSTKRLKKKKMSMISTRFLWRVAARSLYGLISFLCTRYPCLTPDLAVQRLLVAEANLQVADPNLFDATHDSKLKMDWTSCPLIGSGKDTDVAMQKKAVRKASASVLEAYTAAATAAHHPSPPAQAEFLGSPDSVGNLKRASNMYRLEDGHQLWNEEFGFLSMFLQRWCQSSVDTLDHCQQEPELTVVGKSEYAELSRRVYRFWGLHDSVTSMVNAALEKFNRTHESRYSLHVICGVNELVSGPKFCRSVSVCSPHFPCKYQHSHINFLATLDAQPPKLFFAECNHDDYNYNDSWCVPVDWSPPVGGQARCFYCETHGNRIIHPALSVFHGFDFEDAFFGPENKSFYDNDQIIFFEDASVEWVNAVEEDAIYMSYRLRGDHGNGDSKVFMPLSVS